MRVHAQTTHGPLRRVTARTVPMLTVALWRALAWRLCVLLLVLGSCASASFPPPEAVVRSFFLFASCQLTCRSSRPLREWLMATRHCSGLPHGCS